jgi:hypothetical protein
MPFHRYTSSRPLPQRIRAQTPPTQPQYWLQCAGMPRETRYVTIIGDFKDDDIVNLGTALKVFSASWARGLR